MKLQNAGHSAPSNPREQRVEDARRNRASGLGLLARLPDELIVADLLPRLLEPENNPEPGEGPAPQQARDPENNLLLFAQYSSVAACFARDSAKYVRDSMNRRRDQELEGSALLRGLQAPSGRFPFTAQQEQAAGAFLANLAKKNSMTIARSFVVREDWSGAETAFRAACQKWPESADAHSGLGVALCNQKRFTEGEKSLEYALELDASHGEAHFGRGFAGYKQAHYSVAETHLRNAISVGYRTAEAHKLLGLSLLYNQSFRQAEESFSTFLRMRPEHPERPSVLVGLAWAQLHQKHFVPAATSARLSLASRPDNAWGHALLGTALMYLGNLKDAEYSLERSLAVDDRHYFALGNLGDLRRRQQRLEEAEVFYLKALQVNTSWSEVREALEEVVAQRSLTDKPQGAS